MPRYRCIAARPVDLDGGAILAPHQVATAPSSPRHDVLVRAGHLRVLAETALPPASPPTPKLLILPTTPELAPAGKTEE